MRIRDAVVKDKEMSLNILRRENYPGKIHSTSFNGIIHDTQEKLIEQELSLLMEEIDQKLSYKGASDNQYYTTTT